MNSRCLHTLRAHQSRSRKGFSLLEILIALAILALLAGLVITNIDGIFGTAQEDAARTFVTSSVKVPLTQYRTHMGRYPTTDEGLQALITAPEGAGSRWRGPYIEGNAIPLDPWGKPYQYRQPGTHNPQSYDIFSFGPDGVQSETDDVGNW